MVEFETFELLKHDPEVTCDDIEAQCGYRREDCEFKCCRNEVLWRMDNEESDDGWDCARGRRRWSPEQAAKRVGFNKKGELVVARTGPITRGEIERKIDKEDEKERKRPRPRSPTF